MSDLDATVNIVGIIIDGAILISLGLLLTWCTLEYREKMSYAEFIREERDDGDL